MYWFTADHHFNHKAIIKYCNRPFGSVEEMNETLIKNHNQVVDKNDIVIFAGDFCWGNNRLDALQFIQRLNGNHVFLKGSHDHWLPDSAKYIWRKQIYGQFIMVCHYAMTIWERSHYNSWHLFGHSHGRHQGVGKCLDIGVDCFNFYPVSFNEVADIMRGRPDNINLIKESNDN